MEAVDGWTPLHTAAAIGDRTTAEILMENGLSWEQADAEGVRPQDLSPTLFGERVAEVEEPEDRDEFESYPPDQQLRFFLKEVQKEDDERKPMAELSRKLAQLVHKHGWEAMSEYRDESQYAHTLSFLASRGRTSLLRVCLALGADIDGASSDEGRFTALRAAAGDGHATTVAMLLSQGAQMELKGPSNETALDLAVSAGHRQIVAMLVQHGADTTHTSKPASGECTTMELLDTEDAAMAEAIRLFCQKPDEGLEQMERLCDEERLCSASVEMARELLAKGVNPNAVLAHAKRPLHHAASNGLTPLMETLLSAGAEVDAKDTLERTPLHYACMYSYWGAVRVLMEHNANPRLRDSSHNDPAEYAGRAPHFDPYLQRAVQLCRRNRKEGIAQLREHDDNKRMPDCCVQ